MVKVRYPAVAGQFYPNDATRLRNTVNSFLEDAGKMTGPAPKAVIAPHAGYIYSGPIAGSAYAHLSLANGAVRRVVLLGPSHWAHVQGMAASSAEAFASPLGLVPLADQAELLGLPQVQLLDQAHEREHCLEVQLPFLQTIFSDFSLVPLAVGNASPAEVAEVLERLWGGPETVIVISSDLSHYKDYEAARALDKQTSQAIETLQPLTEGQACGRKAINGLLYYARSHKLRVQMVDLRNSGDTAGPRDRVVGYGAYVVWE
jgi:AmmeMemoRadiSam system protein B